MIVIDVGCARYGGAYSIEYLIEEYHPRILYGFDPNWHPSMLTPGEHLGDTEVFVFEKAAWTRDGFVTFVIQSAMGGWVTEDPLSSAAVACIDLAMFIKGLPDEEEIVLKMDAEGAEYELLDHLIAHGVDERLSLAWIEWHDYGVDEPAMRRKSIEGKIRCPLDEWNR